MDFIIQLFIVGYIVTWFKTRKSIGTSDQDFISKISDDDKATKILDDLTISRTLNNITGYMFIALSIFSISTNTKIDGSSSAIHSGIYMGLAAICLITSDSDDSKIKLILLAKSLKQNNKD